MKFFDDFRQTRTFWTLICCTTIFAISLGSIEKVETQREGIFIGIILFCSGLILTINLCIFWVPIKVESKEQTTEKGKRSA